MSKNHYETYCWGSTCEGQLGVGAIEKDNVDVAQSIVQLTNKDLRTIATGKTHSLFCLSDGSVYSCGSNDSGQLGREGQRTRPRK